MLPKASAFPVSLQNGQHFNPLMKFAIVNETKKTPTPKESGHCPFCRSEVISKCGSLRLWHWAHKKELQCDPWWENETEWHRNWKNQFPVNYQEQIHYDENGEKHIADVKTDKGWVLEFQYSFIKSEERISRNDFYKKLVWIVNGTRRKRDKTQFLKLIEEDLFISSAPKIQRVYLDDCALLREWSDTSSPVFFDFGEDNLWCLIPPSKAPWGAVMELPRSLFISMHTQDKSPEEDFEDFLHRLKTIVSSYWNQRQSQSEDYSHSIFPPRYLAYRKRKFKGRM